MKNSLNRLLAGIACTVLIAGLSVPAHAAEAQPEAYKQGVVRFADLVHAGDGVGAGAQPGGQGDGVAHVQVTYRT